MQDLPMINQYLSPNQTQSYHQMNIQNNSLNFKYSPSQQYLIDQQSQMTNYMLTNNVNNLNLNSPTSFSNQSNQFFNNPNVNTNLSTNNQLNRYSPTFNQSSPSLSPNQLNTSNYLSPNSLPLNSSKQPVETDANNNNLKTFNFQNRTHIHGYHNNFEPDYQSRNEYSKSDFSDYEEDKNKNKFLNLNTATTAANKPNLPLSNVDLSPSNASAPRTGSTSPIAVYNPPTVTENRKNKKHKFNFKMKKFKIKGKKSPTKQSKKSNRSQKGKKPGILYSQLNKGINSGTLNSISKMQLSILNTGLIPIETEKAYQIIAKEPFDLSTNKFLDHLVLLRKYNVLFKLEYFVRSFSLLI